jgi:hypothetical protein
MDNIVIVGRASQCVLRDYPKAYHIRIVKEFNERVNYLVNLKGVSREAAESTILRKDKERESSVKASLISRDKQIILAYSRLEKLLGIKIETGARIANTGALEMMLDDGHSLDEIMKAAQKMKEKLLKEGKDPKWYINFKSLSKMIGILLTEDKKSKWR